ncbi:MAG TPA: MiaB/RimO family radical SAM methylthiotransferase, partial [Candidatus Sulfotelmatobacter sp.]|nr:MiaB/RimO family radical SAM methylthiotransferase [Candidatus Sulfotelmatobacter sp.]
MNPSQPGGPLRVALTTLGCKVNFAEMSELAGKLAAAGCDVVPEDEPADVRVLNSCTVTLQADATTRQRLARLRRSDPRAHLVLTGCSVDANPDRYPSGHALANASTENGAAQPRGNVDAVFANGEKGFIADYILELGRAAGAAVQAQPSPYLRARAFLKVQDGSNHRCTYCTVWRARGKAVSVPPHLVVERARALARQGHAEIVLCGVDLGWYGRDLNTNLAHLVAELLDTVPDVRLRLSSINANDIAAELVALNAHERLCSHWHIPLQSGSDRVLKAMHRGYRRGQYRRIADELRGANPLTELTTDVMVAFPGETEADHEDTLALIEEVAFLSCHVFRYSPRRDTPAAASGGHVADAVARRRSVEVRRAAALTGRRARERALGRVHEVV